MKRRDEFAMLIGDGRESGIDVGRGTRGDSRFHRSQPQHLGEQLIPGLLFQPPVRAELSGTLPAQEAGFGKSEKATWVCQRYSKPIVMIGAALQFFVEQSYRVDELAAHHYGARADHVVSEKLGKPERSVTALNRPSQSPPALVDRLHRSEAENDRWVGFEKFYLASHDARNP